MRKISFGSRVFDAFNIFIMLLILVVVLYPILNIIATSFSSGKYIASGSITIWPKGFTVQAYADVFKDSLIYKGYLNSILYAVGSTGIMLLFTSLLAYPLTIPGFAGKKFITIFLMITMFFSGGLIPTYLLMRSLHLLDTVWVMILPGAVGAYNVFLFRTFFSNVPAELKESAVMDGANDVVVLFRIVLPLSKALLATFALFGLVGSWNSWFEALIYLKDQDKYPLQMILRNYLFALDTNAIQGRVGAGNVAINSSGSTLDPKAIRMSVIIITMFPIMAIYPFFQKHFTKGVLVGAIKG
ncbi:putative aldouronate transport system permease protein [Paenibacillus rhizosphaerae]|uniref:Putative aldouronate transport system permease protein n=1 Tax=Paenibacillus rhizosphaerae TaxID=297318 RepID=A0A839TMR9_9BACL|nr:carbohydrate ABC transporter permease [Paenibacillus rhizosphaerae]MBB3127962.1 putative aldouronate transport system permease protein [Paenibacillus rhizosphaerae]